MKLPHIRVVTYSASFYQSASDKVKLKLKSRTLQVLRLINRNLDHHSNLHFLELGTCPHLYELGLSNFRSLRSLIIHTKRLENLFLLNLPSSFTTLTLHDASLLRSFELFLSTKTPLKALLDEDSSSYSFTLGHDPSTHPLNIRYFKFLLTCK